MSYIFDVELEHLDKLKGSGYDFSCSKCGYMYKEEPKACEHCEGKIFSETREIIRSLELGTDSRLLTKEGVVDL